MMATTDVSRREGNSALAIRDDQAEFTDRQLAALKQIGVDTNRTGDVAVFFHQSQRTGLDPFKREIYMITRKGKPTIQTGIDGFYKIADRVSRQTGGTWGITETYWCGEDGQWRDVWLATGPPAAAKVVVERNGSRFTTVALTSEYRADGPLWEKMPSRMIAKCAEALAIRKAFPEDLSGLYTGEEMSQADNGATVTVHQAASKPTGPQSASDTMASIMANAPVTVERIQDCADIDELRAMWSRTSDGHLRELIEARVEDLKAESSVNADTGEVVDAEVVEASA